MPKLMTNRFSHGATHHATAAAEMRPTVGSIVKIRSTMNTRQYASNMIGQVYQVCTDVKGHQPYQVEGFPVWFYETDVEHSFSERPKPGLSRPSQPLGDGGWPSFSPNNVSKTPSWCTNRVYGKWETTETGQWLTRESTSESQMLTREPTAETYMFSREPTAETSAFTRESTFESAAWDPMKDCHFAREPTFEQNAWEPPREQQHMIVWENHVSTCQAGKLETADEDSDDALDQMAVQMAIRGARIREIDSSLNASATPAASSMDLPAELASFENPSFSMGADTYEVCLRGTFLHVGPKSPTSRRAKSAPVSRCLERNGMEDVDGVGQIEQMYVEKFCGDVERLWDTVAAGESPTSANRSMNTREASRSFTFGEFGAEVDGDDMIVSTHRRSYSWQDDEPRSTISTAADQQQIDVPVDLDTLVANMPPNHRELLKEFELGSAELPTIGSAGHYYSHCKPCCFVYTKGCGNGVACVFCHLCDAGEKKRRQKERHEKKRRQWRQMQEKRHSMGRWS